MRQRPLFANSCVAITALAVFITLATATYAQTFITFDVPNATSTQPAAINPAGEITGSYVNAAGKHGFLRRATGALILFDAPNNDPVGVQLIGITSMNAAGRIAGYMFMLARSKYASFIRKTDGSFTVFLEPSECFPLFGALSSSAVFNIEGIAAAGINNRGQTTGICGEFPPFNQSFLRKADGTFIVFRVPVDAPTMTLAQAINSQGDITGYYFTGLGDQAFLRDSNGTITTFGTPYSLVLPTAINAKDEITGSADNHGFLRRSDGTFITFDVPNASSTQPTAINPRGEITGSYSDANSASHGFIRRKNGTLTTFDVPNATNTYATGVNPRGQITGWYSDVGGVHGFVVKPGM
jgi:hypothetical protein